MKVVIFDMDGTLLDSSEDIATSVNFVRSFNHDLAPLSVDDVVKFINLPKRNLSKLFYGTEVYEKRDYELFESHYIEQCIKNTTLYDGIAGMLESLERSGVKMAVATNAYTPFAKKMLSHLEVSRHFGFIIGADEAASKPSPAMLNLALKHFGFRHKEHRAWMVGDNIKDLQAAAQARIDGVFVGWGFASGESKDGVLNSPKELVSLIL